MRRYIIWILFSVLLASCASDDYVDVIPGESIALLSIDCQQGESTSSGTNVLQALLGVEGLEDAGLDFSSKVYLFETADGTFGLCAKVDSKKALTRLLEQHFVASRRCQQLTERKGYQFTVLDDSWLIGFSSDALLVMGPTIKGSSEQAQLQQRMAKYLDADEETGIRSTGVFERLGKDAPVCMVVQMDALPEAAALPLMIGAPKEADASQVWLSAAVTNADGCLEIAGDIFSFNTKIDEALKKSFIDGTDVHRATAALIYGVTPDAVTSEMRRAAKTINFGIIYGMSAFRLAKDLGISRTIAKGFIDNYFAQYPKIRTFIEATVKNAEENGFVETMFHRRRFIANIKSANKLEKAAAERIAVNTPIQGTAADIVKKAMLKVDSALKKDGKGARILLQVHDELIVECPESAVESTKAIIRREMESAVKLSVPLRVSIESGKNWGEFH